MFKKPAGVLMFLLAILRVLGTAEACGCTASACDCSRQGLNSVPHDLPETITRLYLARNQITTVNQTNFSSLHGQKLIDISPEDLMTDCQKPAIAKFESIGDNLLLPGETLRLVCEATGIPTPDITVTLPSGLNATVESVGRVTVDVNGTITVTDLTVEDSGRYVCTATNSVGFTQSVFYPKPPPTFSLGVIVGTVGGALAGIVLIGIVLMIRRKRSCSNQGTPVGQAFYSSAISTTTVITNGQDRTGQTQPISPSIRNPQPVPRPVSSVSEHSYEAVDPPRTGAFPRQTTRSLSSDVTHPLLARQSASPQSETYEDMPSLPSHPRQARDSTSYVEPPSYENVPVSERGYQPLIMTSNGQDTSHGYQPLTWT
ncbi:Protein sidekick-2 [Branchiostoma belcheri]|nr:Protein sidekick-2 [Branchiostoma belcheri]